MLIKDNLIRNLFITHDGENSSDDVKYYSKEKEDNLFLIKGLTSNGYEIIYKTDNELECDKVLSILNMVFNFINVYPKR